MELGALIGGLLTGLREGVEAALIVSIILAYLAKTGNRRHFGKIWWGTAAAVGISLVIGVALFVTVGGFEEPYEQLFEAGAMFLAAGVLTWMLFWMRRQARTVKGQLQAAVDRVLTEGSAWGLAVLAFTAVIREGVETALFLVGQVTAAAGNAPGGELGVLVGALVGLAMAVAIGWLIYAGARRINYGTFFRLTGLALIFIAAGLLSHGVHELIEVGWITIGTQTVFDISAILPHDAGLGLFLRALLGYTSTPELTTLVVYLAYLVPVLWLYLRPVPVLQVGGERAATTA
ncbi:MAG TPA: iron uptake transporter permease EfeU [Candidatus Limnocylindrales bacterium]|nr:iron uptake transporter permease EfeU [Candidatus Limnocylindrales bacterium]